jgi:hypothetical protein
LAKPGEVTDARNTTSHEVAAVSDRRGLLGDQDTAGRTSQSP